MLISKSNWDCGRVKPLLPGLPDGELAPEVLRAVEAHLEACGDCHAEAASFRSLGRTLRTGEPQATELPSGNEAVAWILRQEASRARPWWLLPAGAFRPGAAIGLAMATVLAVMAIRLEPGAAPRPRTTAVAGAPQALPTLIVVDDEQTGRQVLLVPNASAANGTLATP